MKAKSVEGKNVVVNVSPREVEQLRDDEIIIVSRTQLNARLAFASLDTKNKDMVRDIEILRCAISEMMEQEKKKKSMVMGAKMKVGEVKRIFTGIEKMPGNSFARYMDLRYEQIS